MKTNQFQNVTPAAMPTVPQSESTEFLHTRQGGFEVMMLQSLATGLILFIGMLTIALAFGWMDPFKWSAVAGALGTVGWWAVSLRRWTNLTGRNPAGVMVRSVDDDGDPATPKVIRVELNRIRENGNINVTSMFDLPRGVTEEMMAALAVGILRMKRPLTEAEWCGAGRTFAMPGFRQLMQVMESRELVAFKNPKSPNQGRQFTDEGEQFLEQFLPE